MNSTEIVLKPYWENGQVDRMVVSMCLKGIEVPEGETVCTMQVCTVTIPGCMPEYVKITDEEGEIPAETEEEKPYPYELVHWKARRASKGTIQIEYLIRPRVLSPEAICGPYFDFRCEDGGANTAGISILMEVKKADGPALLHWDLEQMPEGSRGVCTYGEGDAEAKDLETLRQSYFAMGLLHSIGEGDFGFYWLAEPKFDIKAVAEYTKNLFAYMQEFFHDTEKVYRIFVRKDPFLTSGGTALNRSYLFGWNETQPCSLEDRKAILAHEMVHNWPHLNDNPYGITTWYSEGTAEYYSVLLPLRLGLISEDEAIAEMQKRTDQYYSNPTRELENQEAAAICWKDRRAQRLSYGRGMIFLINMDIRIRKATEGKHSIDDVVLDILEQGRAGKTLGNDVFLETVKRISGLDVIPEWERMRTGQTFAPISGGFDGRFAVERKEIEEADTGRRVPSWTWKKVFRPESMKHIRYVTWPAVSADGEKIAWVTYQGDMETGAFPSQIHLWKDGKETGLESRRTCVPDQAAQDEVREQTEQTGRSAAEESSGSQSAFSQKQPVFLPDGVHLAYLSDESGEYQVYLKNLETGETRQVTTLRHGVIQYAISADGTKLAFEATLWPQETADQTAFTEMTPKEKAAWKEELDWTPYVAENLTYKMDEWHGMRKGEYSHVGTVDLQTGESRVIDTNGREAVYPSWSPDGTKLAFYEYPYDGAMGRQAELAVCGADGSGLRLITKKIWIYPDHAPLLLADGKTAVCMCFGDFDDGSCVTMPTAVNLETGAKRYLIGGYDEEYCHGVHPMRAGSLEYGDKTPYFCLSKDGEYLYFQTGRHGRYGICRVKITLEGEPAAAERVLWGAEETDGWTDIQEFTMDGSGRFVTVRASWKEPAELFAGETRLTKSNEWLKGYQLADVEEHWVTSKDQTTKLQYFLVRPAGFEKDTVYPAVLDIKGGPETMYGLTFWHEFQALAGAGMAVIFGNPRGSVGFGRKYCAGMCWGQEPVDDLLLFVSDAASQGWIDPARVGVTGGSYGGYMTNKLIGRTDAFAAAVTQRCLANTATSYGTGDMGFVSSRPVPKHFSMLAYLEDRARGNIISYIDHFKIPLLILHAYEDYRCGFEQAEQVFIPMKERNPEVPVRLVMFPGENHGMTRTGKLYHQVRHLQEMTDWFVRYLEVMPDWRERHKAEMESDETQQKTREKVTAGTDDTEAKAAGETAETMTAEKAVETTAEEGKAGESNE